MATVTEKDIIHHLKEKIKFHQNEAKRIENLLSAFTNDYHTSRSRKAKSEADDEEIDSAPEEFVKSSRKANDASGVATASVKPLEIPEKYTDDLPIIAKIAFALNEIGSGFNEDIANTMAQYEPKSDAKKISKQISGILSTLKSKGQLNTEKVGRKDKLSLVIPA
ncbi:hypothetical protein HH214_05585 [Mucilaginibacter robiniae]|uniref:Uncharacterized protein n=1 Tax=Mucilaginibacter robiniae TaxID=2728022 RepID=A0A7L5DWB8_9SPHI|nr:hypothetical protein [Mucilaginibacter robiniae]QJD95380.1 hypothetical protein HH214_05585 [Mucilaginibacter robiniae]